jgi:hypothetical protein
VSEIVNAPADVLGFMRSPCATSKASPVRSPRRTSKGCAKIVPPLPNTRKPSAETKAFESDSPRGVTPVASSDPIISEVPLFVAMLTYRNRRPSGRK